MKKILIGLVLLSFLIALALPIIGLARGEVPGELPSRCIIRRETRIPGCPAPGAPSYYDTIYGAVRGAVCCLMSSIYYFTDWVFVILITLAVIFGLFGAFQIITAGGDTEKVTTGRNFVMFAVIGVAVALVARAIPAVAKVVMGV